MADFASVDVEGFDGFAAPENLIVKLRIIGVVKEGVSEDGWYRAILRTSCDEMFGRINTALIAMAKDSNYWHQPSKNLFSSRSLVCWLPQ